MTKWARAKVARAMVTAMRVAGKEEDEGGKSNGDINKGGRQGTAMAAKRAMAMATRVAGEQR